MFALSHHAIQENCFNLVNSCFSADLRERFAGVSMILPLGAADDIVHIEAKLVQA